MASLMLLAGEGAYLHLEDAGGTEHFRLEAPGGAVRMDLLAGVGGWGGVVVGCGLFHEGFQGRQLFLRLRDDGGHPGSHDALEVAGIVAGCLSAGEPVLPVQLEGDGGIFLQQLVLPS